MIAKERGIRPNLENVLDEITKFPILTKSIIHKQFANLQSEKKVNNISRNTSGGTTGEPVLINQDSRFRLGLEASICVFDEIGGYQIGDKLVRLWGCDEDTANSTNGLINKLKTKIIKNTLYLNSFLLSDDIIKDYLDQISRFRPKVIISYVQSILAIAKYIKINQINPPEIKSIIVSAGVLTTETKSFIEDIFGCKVFNRYGSREVGLIASSCEKSEKLHIDMFSQYIEVLNEENEILTNNQTGNLIITNLNNYVMPLIRYKIGDTGSITDEKCDCGRGFIRLNKVNGRIVDHFKNTKGKLIDGEIFTHLFYFNSKIKQFQIIQDRIDHINLNLVILDNAHLNNTDKELLVKKIKKIMEDDITIEISYFDHITPSKSGKFRYTICLV